MRVKLLYFAALRDLVGVAEETREIPPGLSIEGLAAWLEEQKEPLRGRLGHVRFAKNAVFVGRDSSVDEGDEIAVIPPVSGG